MKITQLILFLVITALSFTVKAQDSEEIIKYRISVMKAYAGHTGAASRIVRGKVDYTDQLLMHATALRDISVVIEGLFPEDSDFGETRSKDEVWSKREDFNKLMKENQQAAEAFYKFVEKGDTAAQADAFKALTDSCKSCHEDFRREEE